MADFTMPSLGADMDEGTLVEWLVGPGDTVAKGDVVAVVETAKSTIEVECFDSGTVGALLVEPGTTVPVGTRMAVIDSGAETTAAAPAPAPATATAPAKQPTVPASGLQAAPGRTTAPARDAVSTPLVRHLAEQKGIDLSSVHGSGKGGPDHPFRRGAHTGRGAAPGEGLSARPPAGPVVGRRPEQPAGYRAGQHDPGR